jgi:hypothetical protein
MLAIGNDEEITRYRNWEMSGMALEYMPTAPTATLFWACGGGAFVTGPVALNSATPSLFNRPFSASPHITSVPCTIIS